ncbi:hypothetical protein Asppvi_004103 [Aspergillus pseudoviridinutans]|uniref:ASST-domain-containing protein n=1 Tax=Aspergillus pseudoviridinutans TaxID=1517512 RepID=A0A9P3B5X3_9EURO|nr:uncharacterized protein Asppvi_004103 [Aspergillus pseudoviridinutans]GIJ85247.1 hypothetical protein Asppvi_004103 [Aspergillus pseudoviridinutans]
MRLGHAWLAVATAFTLVEADRGPYFQSSRFENGDLGQWPMESYRSTALMGPLLNYVKSNPQCKDGQYTLIAPRGMAVPNPGPMIIDQDGHLVWTKHYGQTYNVNVYSYKGQDYLTFWVGNDGIVGHGDGTYYMLDSAYEEAYTVRGANGLLADLHEFHITSDETALFTVYDVVPADLRSAGGPEKGWIWDGTFQEVDIETGQLLFQWRASQHFNLTDGYRGREDTGDSQDRPWDFFHINSVDKDATGNFLVSSRYMSCLTYIDGRTGKIIWRLGGKHNDFQDLSAGAATNFTWQHHARFRDNGSAITLFDNASRGEGASDLTSRGLYLDLDTQQMTVRVRHEYWNPHPISSQSQGSVQLLDSGNVLLGYGSNAAWTEYTVSGDVLCHVHFGPQSAFGAGNVLSYRVFKHAWTGRPRTNPDLSLYRYEAAVSWNGATDVATWVLQGSDTRDPNDEESITFLTAVPKSGFETIIPIPAQTSQDYLRVLGLNATGQILGATAWLHWDPASEEVLLGPGDSDADDAASSIDVRAFLFFAVGFASAVLLAVCAWFVRRWFAARAAGRKRGGWKPVDESDGDEHDLSEREFEGVEFSLLGHKRLSRSTLSGEFDDDD